MKTAELSGAALDYWVAKAEGVADGLVEKDGRMCRVEDWDPDKMAWRDDLAAWKMWMDYAPSQRWDEGGPIIERERIAIFEDRNWNGGIVGTEQFLAGYNLSIQDKEMAYGSTETGAWTVDDARLTMTDSSSGPTYLIAAMRAFVISEYGEEVPEETP